MESIVVKKIVKEESDLLQFEAKKNLARLLDLPEHAVFPISEKKEITITLSIELRETHHPGIIAS